MSSYRPPIWTRLHEVPINAMNSADTLVSKLRECRRRQIDATGSASGTQIDDSSDYVSSVDYHTGQ